MPSITYVKKSHINNNIDIKLLILFTSDWPIVPQSEFNDYRLFMQQFTVPDIL